MSFRTRYAAPIVAGAVFFAAGCGQSAEEKARSQVCDARAEIQKQVTTLKEMTPSTASKDSIKSSLTAIQGGIQKIVDAQPELNGARKADVQAANEQFKSQLHSATDQLTKELSLSGAQGQIKSAISRIGDAYVKALDKVDCG